MRGKLIVVSGPSGAGKSTLIKHALSSIEGLGYSVSATTRKAREGEIDGKHYIFLDREKFERWIDERRFLEWAEYSGNLYGTPEAAVDDVLDSGKSIILEIELQGARKVREKRQDAEMIFVRAPSLKETRRRLEGRATESGDSVESRMATAIREVAARTEFDYEVVNDNRERATDDIVRLIRDIIAGGKNARRTED